MPREPRRAIWLDPEEKAEFDRLAEQMGWSANTLARVLRKLGEETTDEALLEVYRRVGDGEQQEATR